MSAFLLIIALWWLPGAPGKAGATSPPTSAPQATHAAGPRQKEDDSLPGMPLEREIAGSEVHTYNINLQPGQFLHAVVDQHGIDVVVTLTGPGREQLIVVNLLKAFGPEPVSWEATETGTYRLEVRPVSAGAARGKYVITSEIRPSATTQDRNRLAAERLLIEFYKLRQEGSAESQRQAIAKGEQALPLWRELADKYWEAYTLNNIGITYYSLGETQKALDFYAQALPLQKAINNLYGEAAALNSLANIYDDLGERQKAVSYYDQALALIKVMGDHRSEAVVLNNIAGIYDDLGEKRRAMDYYNQALPLARLVGDRRLEAGILQNLGRSYYFLGEPQKAMEYYNQALPAERALGERKGEATTLGSIGFVFNLVGEKQKALEYFNQMLALERAIGDRTGEANALASIGIAYEELGESQKALEFYNQALLIQRAISDRSGEAGTLQNIGVAYSRMGEKQKALTYYNQALPLIKAIGERRDEATTLNDIGNVYADLGEREKALQFYNQALSVERAIGERRREAETLTNTGNVYDDSGEKQKARDYYNQALLLQKAVGDHSGEALILYYLARLERDGGNLGEALRQIEAALAIIETLRTKYTNQELRSAYFATVQDYYKFYIDLLMRLHKQRPGEGYDARALEGSERERARALLETLAEAGADIREGAPPDLLERERSLQIELNAKAQKQIELLSGAHTDEQAAAIAGELEELTTRYQQVEAQIRQKSPRYAALTQPQPLSLREIQTQVLDSDTLLLEYSLGEERSYLWAVTPTSIKSYELPGRDEIEATARQVYNLLKSATQWAGNKTAERKREPGRSESPSPIFAEAASRLSQMVLAPAAAQLGGKRLVVVSDGALQFIPFGALPIPTSGQKAAYQPLIIEHEIVSLPSASTLVLLRQETARRKPAAKTVIALADPVFQRDDRRITNNAGRIAAQTHESTSRADTERGLGLATKAAQESGVTNDQMVIPRLPGTRREAEQILQLVPASERKSALGFAASRETAMSAEVGQYRYVHFATHGLLDSLHPELSGIILSMFNEQGTPQDGFLRAHEIFNLKLAADVVVLSACQTGLGKEVKGEGLVGLTRGFMYAGAPRVVVSLWSVSDVATAELMTRFYRRMLIEKLAPAKALQAAQASMAREKRFASPFYWAAFTLQGEWR